MAWKLIDISKHQGTITVVKWDSIKTKTDGVIIRAGFGNTSRQKDTQFESNYSACKSLDIPCGAYWYSYAQSVEDARKEARAFLECISGKKFAYPVYYDMEDNSMIRLGKETLTEMAIAFCTILEQAGYWAGVYANTNWFTNYLDYKTLKTKYTLWRADYRAGVDYSTKDDIWQFSSKNAFKVEGFGDHLDCNWCYRDFPTLIKAAGLNGFAKTASAPAEAEKKKLYTLTVTASSGDKDKLLDLCNELQLTAHVEVQ